MKKILLICVLVFVLGGGLWLYKHPSLDKQIQPSLLKHSTVQLVEHTETTNLYTIEVRYPQTGYEAVDELLVDAFDTQMNDLKELAQSSEAFIADFGIPYSLQSDYNITRNDNTLLSFRLEVYEYTGGAHGNTVTLAFVYDKEKQELLQVEDLFDGNTDYLFFLSDQAIQQLSVREGLENTEWLQEGAGADRANFQSFVLTETEIIFIFDAYQVGPYSSGIQEVRFPLDSLTDFLHSDYQQL